MADNERNITTKFKADISELKSGITQANRQIKIANSAFEAASSSMDDWENSAEGLRKKLDQLESVLESETSKLKALDAQRKRTLQYQKEQAEQEERLKTQIKSLTAEYEKVISSEGKRSKNATDLKKKINELNSELANSVKEQEKASVSAQNLEVKFNKQQATVNKVEKELEEYRSELANVGQKSIDLGNSQQTLSEGFTVMKGVVANLITDGLRKLGESLKEVATQAIRTGIEFESAFAGVKKTVDATEEEYAQLEKEIINMSKTMPASASEIAAVAEVAGQLGIKKDDIIAFTKVMIDLGESTVLSSEEAATSLARLANIMGTSSKDYDKLGSVLVDLGNNFATTEAEILEMTMRIAGAGATIGLTESEIMGIATALSSVGIEAEMGGSAISKAMSDMALAVETGKGKFADLETYAKVAGMTSKEFAETMKKDAAGAIQAFILGLGNIDEQGGSTLVALQDLGFEEVRLRDTMLRASNASEVFTSAIELGSKAWEENNALTEEANKRYSTTESRIAMMKNEMTAFGLDIYSKFKEPIGDAVSSVSTIFKDLQKEIGNGKLGKSIDKIAESFGSFVKEASQFTAKVLVKLINGLTTLIDNWDKIGPAIGTALTALIAFKVATTATTAAFALAKTGVAAFNLILGAYKIATGAATAAQLGWNAAMLANPIGIVVGLVAGLITALGYLIKKSGEAQIEETELTETIKEQSEEVDELTKKTEEAKRAKADLTEATKKSREEGISEINYIQDLRTELSQLVDANGNVKKGYEERVKFITGQLNSALGTELELIDGQVKGYSDAGKAIDELIEKEKAYIVWQSQKDEYEASIASAEEDAKLWKENKQAVENLTKTKEAAVNREMEARKKLEESLRKDTLDWTNNVEDVMNRIIIGEDGTIKWDKFLDGKAAFWYNEEEIIEYVSAMKEAEETTKKLEEANGNLEESNKSLSNSLAIQMEYERNAEDIQAGRYKAVLDRMNSITEANANMNAIELKQTAQYQSERNRILQEGLAQAQLANDEYAMNKYNKEIESNNASLKNTMDFLAQQTSTVQANSPEVVQAWQDLYKNSKDQFDLYMKNLNPELQTEIAMMVNGVNTKSPEVQEAFYNLATNSETSFEEEINKLSPATQKELLAVLDTLEENDPLLALIAKNLGLTVSDNFDKSNNAETSGKNMLNSYRTGFNKPGELSQTAGKLGSSTAKAFDKNSEAETSGENIVWGLNRGVKNSKAQTSVLGSAANLATSLLNKFKGIFDEHSPSKETEEMGKFLVVGLANGIKKFASTAITEAGNLGTSVLNELEGNSLSSGLNSSLSNIRSNISGAVDTQNRLLGNSGAITNNDNSKTTNITYNQTINSPKAVSRAEIYRQSKNAVGLLGGVY